MAGTLVGYQHQAGISDLALMMSRQEFSFTFSEDLGICYFQRSALHILRNLG